MAAEPRRRFSPSLFSTVPRPCGTNPGIPKISAEEHARRLEHEAEQRRLWNEKQARKDGAARHSVGLRLHMFGLSLG